jgi:hybrid cluster-associated redox disulfide protein
MRPERPSERLTVAEVLRRWPQLGGVFLRRRLACPGCAMAPFDTLRDVAQAYGLDVAGLLEDVERAAAAGRRP